MFFYRIPRYPENFFGEQRVDCPYCRQAIQIELTYCLSCLLLQVGVKEQEPVNGNDYSSLEINKGKLLYWQGFFWVTINKTAHFPFWGY